MSEEEKAIQDIRRLIDRWRRMVSEVEGAQQSEVDAVLYDLEGEMAEALNTRLFKWMP